MKAAVYLRVSRDDQDEENQRADCVRLAEARGWTPVFFVDHGKTGGNTERDAYQSMMADARRGKLQAVVVWKLDRLGRTVRQLIDDFDHLKAWGVELVAARDPVDTTTAFGKAMFQIIAVFAELERGQISERTIAAYETKKARAENLGQKVKWGRKANDIPQALIDDLAAGMSKRAAAAKHGVSRRMADNAAKVARKGEGVDAAASTPVGEVGTEGVDFGPAVGRNETGGGFVGGSEAVASEAPQGVPNKAEAQE